MANYCYNEITITGPSESVHALHTALLSTRKLTETEVAQGRADTWVDGVGEVIRKRHHSECCDEEHMEYEEAVGDEVVPFHSVITREDDGDVSTIRITCHTKWVPFHDLFDSLAHFYPEFTIELWGEEFGRAGAWKRGWEDGEHVECDTAELLTVLHDPSETGFVLVLKWEEAGTIETRFINEPKSEILRVWLLGVPEGEFDPEGTIIVQLV